MVGQVVSFHQWEGSVVSTPQSGMSMMFKALGLDPKMFTQVVGAVQEIANSLQRIEQKQDQILLLLKSTPLETSEKEMVQHGRNGS